MKLFLPILVSALLLCGCKTNGPMTHAAFRAAVTLGEQVALEQHPEATPYLRAATPVVCAVANSTNASAGEIVAALEAAGVTNQTAKLIINGSLALLNVVVSGLGTNQTEARLYSQDLCAGMQAGLPPAADGRESMVRRNVPALNFPHLH